MGEMRGEEVEGREREKEEKGGREVNPSEGERGCFQS